MTEKHTRTPEEQRGLKKTVDRVRNGAGFVAAGAASVFAINAVHENEPGKAAYSALFAAFYGAAGILALRYLHSPVVIDDIPTVEVQDTEILEANVVFQHNYLKHKGHMGR